MRTAIIKTLLCCLSLTCISCIAEADLGYPSDVFFTKEGGEKTITGGEHFFDAVIQDFKGNHGYIESGDEGENYNVYDWLRVEYHDLWDNELKIYATPNTTGHRRTLYIELYAGPEYQVVRVRQNK